MSEFLSTDRNEGYEACDDEDGGLMVGASLKPADFVQIINAANQE